MWYMCMVWCALDVRRELWYVMIQPGEKPQHMDLLCFPIVNQENFKLFEWFLLDRQ